jgi:gas vesicle protein GvpA/GvpJ/GvpM family
VAIEPPRGARSYQGGGNNLVDILDRILDKGLVVAGDIRISLANVELLTVRIRLLVCSIDKAEQIGLNWWRYDRSLVAGLTDQPSAEDAIARLESRILELERQLGRSPTSSVTPSAPRRARRR